MTQRKLKLTLQYVGTRYCGWQRQATGLAVQEVVETVLRQVLQEKITVVAAGRTDVGVHALGQVAHCRLSNPMPLDRIRHALQSLLPEDIALTAIEEVGVDFHAQKQAKAKTYVYFILKREQPLAFLSPYSWRRWGDFDEAAVEEALELLPGRHDFSAFRASDCQSKSPVKQIHSARLTRLSLGDWVQAQLGFLGLQGLMPRAIRDDFHGEVGPEIIAIALRGESFLKHMVRNIVGTLVDVGQGKIAPGDFEDIFQARDRRRAGPTAPAQGLFLMNVEY